MSFGYSVIKKPEAAVVPHQKFHAVAPAIDEDINVAAGGIAAQRRGDHAREPSKLLRMSVAWA